jgi:hypothetical protein
MGLLMTIYAARVWGLTFVFFLCSFCSKQPLWAGEDESKELDFSPNGHRVKVVYGGIVLAEYVQDDPAVSHPYWHTFRTLSGIQVTRNHPPVASQDRDDHSGLHTGAWLAFGDVSGHDFWRLKAKVVSKEYELITGGAKSGVSMETNNDWLTTDESRVLMKERTSYEVTLVDGGYLLTWDSKFRALESDVIFGDQEEMGLGIRAATPLAVDSNRGGRILDSEGRRNGSEVWGKVAAWCDYSGPIEGRWVGITVLVDSEQGRPARSHARDYGFLAMNPFSTKAFTGGEPTPFTLKMGETVPLRYGLYIHEHVKEEDFSVAPVEKLFLHTAK